MAEKHFHEQQVYTSEFLIPYLKKNIPDFSPKNMKILEIGCAEGGSLYSLSQKGFSVHGMEIESARVEIAKKHLPPESVVSVGDITDSQYCRDINTRYNLIIMRDVIEHIDNKKLALENIFYLLDSPGYVFITFPLKYSPFAGHQQNSKTLISKFIYISLLPEKVIRGLGVRLHDEKIADHICYMKKNAVTFSGMKKVIKEFADLVKVDFYLSRPIFKYRFGLPIIKTFNIPVLRELASACEMLVKG